MKGTVVLINPQRGLVAVETSSGLSVFEVLEVSCSIELGDEIIGNLESSGGEKLRNVTKAENIDVFIDGIHCDRKAAIDLMR